MPGGKRKSEPGPAARSPKKKSKTSSRPTSNKSSARSSQKTENRAFRLWDPANPLAGTVVDDFLSHIEDEIRSSSGRFEGQRQRQEESNREHKSTIVPDDDDVLDIPDLPFTVQWCTTFLLKDEDGKQIDKDARLFTHSDSFNYEKWRRTQSELVKKFCIRKRYAEYAGPVCVVLKCSDHKHKQDMNCNTPEDWEKPVEILASRIKTKSISCRHYLDVE